MRVENEVEKSYQICTYDIVGQDLTIQSYIFWRGGAKIPVLVSRNFKLACLEGSVTVENMKPVSVMLGYHDIALFDRQRERGKWTNTGKVVFKGYDRIGHGCKIVVGDNGTLVFDENVSISAETEICCQEFIKFGKHNVISWDCIFMDTDLHKIYDAHSNKRMNKNEEIILEDDVWIGCRCTILKGAHISKGCIVGAGSRLSSNVGEANAVIGDYGKILRKNIRWDD